MTPEEIKALVANASAEAAKQAISEMKKSLDAESAEIKKEITGAPLIAKFAPKKNQVEKEGLGLARCVIAGYKAQNDRISSADAAECLGWKNTAEQLGQQKVLNEGTDANGGLFVPVEISGEMIELLRANVMLDKAGCRQVPMNRESMTFVRQTGTATSAYIAEGGYPTNSTQTLDAITINLKKFSTETLISNDLLRDSSINAQQFVQEDLLASMVRFEDLKFFEGSGASGEVLGLGGPTQGSGQIISTAQNAAHATATLTHAEIVADFEEALYELASNNVPVDTESVCFFMNPAAEYRLRGFINAVGAKAFPEMAQGRIMGYRYFTSSQLSTTSTASRIYCVKNSEVMIGRGINNQVVFDNTYVVSGTSHSASARDQVVVRVWSRHDILMRHNTGGSIIHTVDWVPA